MNYTGHNVAHLRVSRVSDIRILGTKFKKLVSAISSPIIIVPVFAHDCHLKELPFMYPVIHFSKHKN